MSLIEASACVNASSSDLDWPFTNLNYGAPGYWSSAPRKPLPAFLNFDLQKNHLLEKIRIIAHERDSAPKEMRLDYFGNDLKLIGNNIAKFEFDAPNPNFQRYQDFSLERQSHSVKFIRIRFLSTWGAATVKIRCFAFFGRPSNVGIKQFKEEELDPSMYEQWYVGDRVRYLGPDGDKWYEGLILHINPSDTYLIQDDHGWVKDHIKRKNTRKPRYARKPRKLKASTSQISVATIVEKEEIYSESESTSEGSYDEAPFVMKKELEMTERNTRPKTEEKEEINKISEDTRTGTKPALLTKVKKKAIIAQGFSKEALNGVYTIAPNLMGGRPMFKDGGGRVMWWYRDVKTWMICMEHLVGTDRAYACAHDSAMHPADITAPWHVFNKANRNFAINSEATVSPFECPVFNAEDEEEEEIPETVIAKNFRKAVNGIYTMTTATHCGRPVYQGSDMKVVLWWYLKTRMWMFSPAKHVGTEKCYAYCQEPAKYPYNVGGPWISYTSTSKEYLPDPGVVTVGAKRKKPSNSRQKHRRTDTPIQKPNHNIKMKMERLTSSGTISLYLKDDKKEVEENNIKIKHGRHKRNDTPIIRRQRSTSDPKVLSDIKDILQGTVIQQRPRSRSFENVASSILAAKRTGAFKE